MAPTYRHKFTNSTMEEMKYFAAVHKDDERKVCKEAFERWVNNKREIINMEQKRHEEAGYEGDIIPKMYHSIRHYLMKVARQNEEKKAKKRRSYVTMSRDLLKAMDNHIEKNPIKPSIGFDNFCNSHKEVIKREIMSLKKSLKGDEISEKIKHTYRNRYDIWKSKENKVNI